MNKEDEVSSQVSAGLNVRAVVDRTTPEENTAKPVAGSDNIAYCNSIFASAYVHGASDIHIEPYERAYRVRFRIDGRLTQVAAGAIEDHPQLVSRFKILANLDIGQRRRPQEGRLRMSIEQNFIDYRLSVLPTTYGEKLVLRVIDAAALHTSMDQLGMSSRDATLLEKVTSRTHGMCLVTGPTGCGKTTTLYCVIKRLNEVHRNISTIEDPVEYDLFGVNQVNVNRDIDMGFPQVLRLLMRQDPDVILLGEIRDQETASVAFQAALTGHLILSTLHTNDSVSAISRLRDMGIDPFLLVSGLKLIIAQRLTRRLCDKCKVPVKYSDAQLSTISLPDRLRDKATFFRPHGCQDCHGIGFQGRVGVFEVLPITPELCEMVFRESSENELRTAAARTGMKPLRYRVLQKAAQGSITLEEACLHL